LPRLDLLKIDVERHEAEVLAAAADTLTRLRPVLISETADGPSTNAQIANLLEPAGYDIVAARTTIAR
jgi:hypothetical protein